MRQAIGEILPLAVAAAISPIPIVGVVLMLVTPRARLHSLTFVAGWLIGLAVVGTIGLTVASATGASDQGAPSSGADTFQIVLGALLVLFAFRQWRKRPAPGEEPVIPKWMEAVDRFTAARAATLGFGLSAVNPKNLLLTLAAATSIAATGLAGSEQVVAFTVYVLVATLGVGTPIVISMTMGARSRAVLDDLKTWLVHHNAAIMAVLFLVIGVKILGQGIAG